MSAADMQGVHSLLTRLRAFCLPGGEDAARFIRAVRTTEKGQIHMSPEARWIPFTAKRVTDSTRSSFRWEARLDPGKITSPTVTDAYEDGHGRPTVKLAGIVPVKKIVGPETRSGGIATLPSLDCALPADPAEPRDTGVERFGPADAESSPSSGR